MVVDCVVIKLTYHDYFILAGCSVILRGTFHSSFRGVAKRKKIEMTHQMNDLLVVCYLLGGVVDPQVP